MKYIKSISVSSKKEVFLVFTIVDLYKMCEEDNETIKPCDKLYFTVIEFYDTDTGESTYLKIGDCTISGFQTKVFKMIKERVLGVDYLNGTFRFAKYYYNRGSLLDKCMDFIGFSKDVPWEIYSYGSREMMPYYYSLYWWCPAYISFNGRYSFFGSEGYNEVCTIKDYDTHFAESLILQYLKEFTLDSKEMARINLEYIRGRYRDICGSDLECDDKFDERGVMCIRLWEDIWYSLHNNAYFQAFGCPLYISNKGEVYLAYTLNTAGEDGLIGCMEFEITDLKLFRQSVAKSLILDVDGLYNNMKCEVVY